MERLLRTDPKYYSGQFPNYSQPPEEVDVFSLTSGGFSDDPKKNLKYYIEPEENAYPFKLDNGYDIPGKFVHEWKDQEGQHDLHHILGWIKDHPSALSADNADNGVDFVTLRSRLNKVACTPYDHQGWKLAVTKFKGIWYISQDREQRKDDHQNKPKRTAAEEQRRAQWKENKQKNLYMGHKFEQYLTADKAGGEPDTDAVVDVNEGFYTVVKPKLNSHSLLFSAEIDARNPDVEGPPPACYVEMKTNYQNQKDESRFYSYQKCWVQSFLVGVPEIVFGFHDDKGRVRNVPDHYRTSDMPAEVAKYNKEWKASVCMNFCDKFLSYVKDCVTKDDPSVVYLFQRERGAVHVTWKECCGLPAWYTDAV